LILNLNQTWSNIRTAHRLIILDISTELFENSTRGSKDIEQTQNTIIQSLTLKYVPDLEPTMVKHALHIRLIILNICAQLFENPTRGSKDIERTQNTIIQSLTLNFDRDLELTLVKHTLHIDSSYLTFVQIYLKIPQGVQKI